MSSKEKRDSEETGKEDYVPNELMEDQISEDIMENASDELQVSDVPAEAKEETEKKPKKSKNSGRHGKGEKPEWVNYEKEEIEKLILKLSQKGLTSSKIGIVLRDQYGIPDVKAFGITIGKVLKSQGAGPEIPEDLYNLMKKAVMMNAHLQKNKKDRKNVHRLQLIESRIRKLGRYYSKIGKIPKDWKYDINKAKLMVK